MVVVVVVVVVVKCKSKWLWGGGGKRNSCAESRHATRVQITSQRPCSSVQAECCRVSTAVPPFDREPGAPSKSAVAVGARPTASPTSTGVQQEVSAQQQGMAIR
jgi:hypothetical protein